MESNRGEYFYTFMVLQAWNYMDIKMKLNRTEYFYT